jgi:hypothetical protein
MDDKIRLFYVFPKVDAVFDKRAVSPILCPSVHPISDIAFAAE